jgi:cell division protein FtsI/penicillin-binding protein 2
MLSYTKINRFKKSDQTSQKDHNSKLIIQIPRFLDWFVIFLTKKTVGLGVRTKSIILYTVSTLFVLYFCLYISNIQKSSVKGAFTFLDSQELLTPKKGQIYLQNLTLQNYKELTKTAYYTKLIINPSNLNYQLKLGKFNLDEASLIIKNLTSLELQTIKTNLTNGIKNEESSYFVLANNLEQSSTLKLRNIMTQGFFEQSDYQKFNLNSWLYYEDYEIRAYPNNNLLANAIGYSSSSIWSTNDIKKEGRCDKLLQNNQSAQKTGYIIGLTGLEAKYCGELYGYNGSKNKKQPVDGEDLFLTIDYNLQIKAEEINQKLITNNTNSKGAPKNATTMIVEVNAPDPINNGRVLAMASSPNFNPNDYSNDYQTKPSAFLDYNTDSAYENGSVIKPLFVSALLNEYTIAKQDNPSGSCEVDKRLCVSFDWRFKDTCGGRKLTYPKETITIKNFNNICYTGDPNKGGTNGLKEVIRDSINTGITEMSLNITSSKLTEYLNNFGFGQKTTLDMPIETGGNTNAFKTSSGYNINNAFFGFGQGFANTPAQLLQAYIPLTNGGFSYPLKLVSKIGTKTVNYSEDQNFGKSILNQEAANAVKSYMIATSSEGNRGVGKKIELNGYGNGSKTGTAQIARSEIVKDAYGQPILESDGQPKREYCDYDCNSKKGLYEFTLIGFAPAQKPRFLILTKVSEPRPGESENLSNYNVQKKEWEEMMQYTLEYMGVNPQF